MTDIVFVHGFLGSNQDFRFMEDFCKRNQLRPHFVSLPVHGNLSPMKNYSLKAFSEFLFQYCSHKGLTHSIFWGYSMGGRILLELFREHPEIFKALILESTSPGIQDAKLRTERVVRDKAWSTELQVDYPLFLEKWYSQDLFLPFKGSKVFQSALQTKLSNHHPDLAKVLVDSSPGANSAHYEILDNLTIPCLALVGEKDEKYKDLWQKRFEKNKNIDIRIVPESGHVIHLENPESVQNSFKEFIKRLF